MVTITGVIPRPTTYTGLWSWLTTVDHKRIAALYGFTAFAFFLVGGIEATVLRLQLVTADSSLVSPDTFNAMFTMHATTMIFMVVMPFGATFFNFLIPLMIGARDVAFPRLNAFSYWTFLFGALLMHGGFIVGDVPDAGWFSYANLTAAPFSQGQGLDFWALSLQGAGGGVAGGGFQFCGYHHQYAGAGDVADADAGVRVDDAGDEHSAGAGVSDHHGGADSADGRPAV